MTVSVKAPTSTTGSIQLNGSDVLTIDSSNQVTTTAPLTVKASTSSATMKINGRSSDNLGGLFFYANDGTTESARITASASEYRVTAQSTAVQTFYTNGSERMRIDSSTGSVRIGSNNAYGLNEKVMIYGSSTANQPTILSSKEASGQVSSNHFLFQNTQGTVGSITTASNATSFNTSSDYRLKENVAPMSGSIDRLKQLKPSTWTWINGGNGEGFLAHEAQTVVPEAVSGTKDAVNDEGNPIYQGIDQSKFVPLLTSALQEAITKIEDLETRIQALESA